MRRRLRICEAGRRRYRGGSAAPLPAFSFSPPRSPWPPWRNPRQPPHLARSGPDKPPIIDGRLDDEAWRATPGTEALPRSRSPSTARRRRSARVLRVLYDETALYVGFDCEQIHTPIVEHLTRRDRDSESEWVWVLHRFAQRRQERLRVRGQHLGRARRRTDHRPDDVLVGVGRELGGEDGAHAHRLVGRDPDPAARAALRRQPPRAELGVPGDALHRRSARRTTCGPTSRATSPARWRSSDGSTTCAGSRARGALELLPFALGYVRRQRRRPEHAGAAASRWRARRASTSSGTSPTT